MPRPPLPLLTIGESYRVATLLEIREKSGETLFGEKVQEIHAKTVKVREKSGKIKLLYKYLRKC